MNDGVPYYRTLLLGKLYSDTAQINLSNTPFERETPRHQYSKKDQSNNSKNKRKSTIYYDYCH